MVISKPLYSVEQIQRRVKALGEMISKDYRESKELLVIGLLKGAFMFTSDLVRNINVPMIVDFITVSSYVKTSTSGIINVVCDIKENVEGKDVLLVEDIVDTGLTLSHVKEKLLEGRVRSLKICALLNKKGRREVDVPIDYLGFDIPDEFVVGYGLDYENRFRNLPYIAIFKKEK